MNRTKVMALAPFAAFIAMFFYLFAIKALGDPRLQDLKLEGSEMHWFEGLWLALTLFGVIFVWLRSLWHSFQARQIAWLVAIFLAWPAAAFYVWKQE
jgi:hypothetical protein